MRTFTVASLLALTLAAPLHAGGFDPARVPADAVAVAHVDVEGLVRSQLWREIQRHHPEIAAELDLGKQHPMLAGVKPLEQVRSVTIFTREPQKERFAALLQVDARLEEAMQVAFALDQYEALEVDGRAIHSWSDGDQRVFAYVQPAGDDRLVLLTNDTHLLGKGLAVLTSGGANLSSSKHAVLRSTAQPGTIFYAASAEPLTKLGEVDPDSSVAELVQAAVVQFGETHGAVFGNLSLLTDKPQDALRLSQVLQGLTALASLAAENAEEARALSDLVSALDFQANGNQLFVEFRYDLLALIDLVKRLEEMH